jgi:hypothetical protein
VKALSELRGRSPCARGSSPTLMTVEHRNAKRLMDAGLVPAAVEIYKNTLGTRLYRGLVLFGSVASAKARYPRARIVTP